MKTADARTLAHNLMTEHGLTAKGWKVEFDGAQQRMGQCRYRARTIGLSTSYVDAADIKLVTNTILHEIAHALVGPGHGHGDVWKAQARKLGAAPKSTGTNPAHEATIEAELAAARAAAPSVANVTTGPLQMGERVRSKDGRYRGIFVKPRRTKALIIHDKTDKGLTITLANLVRENAPETATEPAPEETLEVLDVGDRIQSLSSGRVGRIVGVGRSRYKFKVESTGEVRVVPFAGVRLLEKATPSDMAAAFAERPQPRPTVTRAAAPAVTFREKDQVIIVRPRSKFNGVRGTVVKPNAVTVTIMTDQGEMNVSKELLRKV